MGKHISLMGNTASDMCVAKHASLRICVRETSIPGKHILKRVVWQLTQDFGRYIHSNNSCSPID